jgi:GPH family glycoside/pentoside/hexuronide:cation symporter
MSVSAFSPDADGLSGRSTDAIDSRVPSRSLVAYSVPAVTSSFIFTAVSLYLLKYSTDVLLIAPATVGLIFGFARFWDAATDPLVGHLSDRTRSRWGRRRPWMLAAAVPVGLAYFAIWSPPAGLAGNGLALWMAAAILLFYAAITMFSVPYTALGAELSQDYHDRTRVFGAKAVGENVGIVLAAASLLVLERSAEPRATAAAVAALAGLFMLGGIAWAVRVLREPDHHQGRGGTRSPYASFGDVFRNPDARTLLAVFFLEMLGYQTFVVLLPYLTEYILGMPGSTAFYLFGAIAATLVTIPLWVRLATRFDKVRLWGASLAVKIAVFGGIGFVGAGEPVAIAVLTVIFGAASGAGAVLGPSLKADVVDSDEAQNGERKEGTFFAAWGLAIKSAIGCAILVSGFVLSATGFQPNTQQTPDALAGIRSLVSVFPLVCHVLALALLRRLRMTEAAHHDIRRCIEERRTATGSAA